MPATATRNYKRLSEEEIARARKLISEGMTVKVVADNLNVSVATIYKLTKNGDSQKSVNQPEVKQVKENTLAAKVKQTFEKLEAKVKFHQEKAEWFQSQVNELKGVFSS